MPPHGRCAMAATTSTDGGLFLRMGLVPLVPDSAPEETLMKAAPSLMSLRQVRRRDLCEDTEEARAIGGAPFLQRVARENFPTIRLKRLLCRKRRCCQLWIMVCVWKRLVSWFSAFPNPMCGNERNCTQLGMRASSVGRKGRKERRGSCPPRPGWEPIA